MDTILERAESFAESCQLNGAYREFAERGYMQGASEQQRIDINKACEWLQSNGAVVGITLCTGETLIDAFRNAMEE